MIKKFLLCHGNLDSTNSVGTNKLIKNGAYLVTEAKDIFKYFPEFKKRARKNDEKFKTIVAEEFKDIYKYILKGIKNADEIALKTNNPISEVLQKLTLMELEGLIEQEIGNGFKVKN